MDDNQANVEGQIVPIDSGNGKPSPLEVPPEVVPDDKEKERALKELFVSFTKKEMKQTRFTGPLPPPDLLKGYEEIVPGLAERIIRMTEKQQEHRIALESSVVQENCRSQRRGLHYGFVIALLVILGGFFLVYEGKNTSGVALVIAALASLVGVFVYGKLVQSEQLKRRNKPSDTDEHLITKPS